MTKRTVDESGAESTEELHFFYDAQSRPTFVKWNNAMYRYVHNLQGDIVGIVDSNGNLVVEYKYDTWGKLISTNGSMTDTLGKQNLFRYRGYIYDEETRLYYLRSRYYDMVACRFVNEDDFYGELAQRYPHNLYCYCMNAPFCYADRNGRYLVDESEKEQYNNYRRSIIECLSNKFERFVDEMKKHRKDYPCIPKKVTPKTSAGIKYVSKDSVKSEDLTAVMLGNLPKFGAAISNLSGITGAGESKLNSGTYGFIQYSYKWAYVAADGTIHPQHVTATQYFTTDPSAEDITVYEAELVDPYNLVAPLTEVYY